MMEFVLHIHVVSGIIVLITGALILAIKKGDPRHKLLGWIYAALMFIIFISSTYVSLSKGNIFLLLIGFFSFYMVHSGISVNRLRLNGHCGLFQKISTLVYGSSFATMIVVAILALINGNTELGIILGVFGLIGAQLVFQEVRYYFFGRKPMLSELIREHIGRFIGSYIAAFTAFAVNNVHFPSPIVVWLTPTVLGFILIAYFSRPYRKRAN